MLESDSHLVVFKSKDRYSEFTLVFLELFQVRNYKQKAWYHWENHKYQCPIRKTKGCSKKC